MESVPTSKQIRKRHLRSFAFKMDQHKDPRLDVVYPLTSKMILIDTLLPLWYQDISAYGVFEYSV